MHFMKGFSSKKRGNHFFKQYICVIVFNATTTQCSLQISQTKYSHEHIQLLYCTHWWLWGWLGHCATFFWGWLSGHRGALGQSDRQMEKQFTVLNISCMGGGWWWKICVTHWCVWLILVDLVRTRWYFCFCWTRPYKKVYVYVVGLLDREREAACLRGEVFSFPPKKYSINPWHVINTFSSSSLRLKKLGLSAIRMREPVDTKNILKPSLFFILSR